MNDFVKERHAAFADVLNKQDFKKLEKYSKKYGIKMPNRKIATAGVMKAIQYSTDFSDEEKMKAQWCLDNGFNPFIKPADWGR